MISSYFIGSIIVSLCLQSALSIKMLLNEEKDVEFQILEESDKKASDAGNLLEKSLKEFVVPVDQPLKFQLPNSSANTEQTSLVFSFYYEKSGCLLIIDENIVEIKVNFYKASFPDFISNSLSVK